MTRWHCNGIVGLFIGCLWGLAGSAWAGPYVNLMQPCDCPPNHYSAFEVLTPAVYRWAAWCQLALKSYQCTKHQCQAQA